MNLGKGLIILSVGISASLAHAGGVDGAGGPCMRPEALPPTPFRYECTATLGATGNEMAYSRVKKFVIAYAGREKQACSASTSISIQDISDWDAIDLSKDGAPVSREQAAKDPELPLLMGDAKTPDGEIEPGEAINFDVNRHLDKNYNFTDQYDVDVLVAITRKVGDRTVDSFSTAHAVLTDPKVSVEGTLRNYDENNYNSTYKAVGLDFECKKVL